MSTTFEELQAAQQRLQQAQNAERVRLEKEAEARRQIEAERSNIERLQRQARQEAFAGTAEGVSEAAAQVNKDNRALIDALDRGDVYGAPALYEAAMNMWHQYQALYQQALATVDEDVLAFSQQVGQQTVEHNARFATAEAARRLRADYAAQLPVAVSAPYALLAWLAQSPNDAIKRIRRGLVYAAGYGDALYNPLPEYNAERAYRGDQAVRRGLFR